MAKKNWKRPRDDGDDDVLSFVPCLFYRFSYIQLAASPPLCSRLTSEFSFVLFSGCSTV